MWTSSCRSPRKRNVILSSFVVPTQLVAPFTRAWQYKELIRAVVRRELISSFSRSALRPLWFVLAPLFMILTCTAIFSPTLPQFAAPTEVVNCALNIFVGLIMVRWACPAVGFTCATGR